MIVIPQLNSIKWLKPITTGFESPRTRLFANQRRGVIQNHLGRFGACTRQILAFNSKVLIQISATDDETIEGSTLTIGDISVSINPTLLQGGYYNVEYNLDDFELTTGEEVTMYLNIGYLFGGDDFNESFTSEPICIMTFGQQTHFYSEPKSFALAYKGDGGLYNGYYWDEEQQVFLNNVIFKELGNELEKESSTSNRGEEEIHSASNLNTYSYRFAKMPEYLYNIIKKASSCPVCYVNGLAVTVDSISEDEVFNGLVNFTIIYKEASYQDVYGSDDFIDYNIPDYDIELWGENDIVALDDSNTALEVTY